MATTSTPVQQLHVTLLLLPLDSCGNGQSEGIELLRAMLDDFISYFTRRTGLEPASDISGLYKPSSTMNLDHFLHIDCSTDYYTFHDDCIAKEKAVLRFLAVVDCSYSRTSARTTHFLKLCLQYYLNADVP